MNYVNYNIYLLYKVAYRIMTKKFFRILRLMCNLLQSSKEIIDRRSIASKSMSS